MDGTIRIELDRAPELAKPGKGIRLEGKGLPENVLVIHGDDGRFYALHNKCSHGGRPLDPVPGAGTVQCCSVGKSTFDYSGKRPAVNAIEDITTYPVRRENGTLFIILKREAETADSVSSTVSGGCFTTCSGVPMNQSMDLSRNLVLNHSLKVFFKQAVRVAVRNPMQAYTFLRTLYWLRQAAAIRARWKQENIIAPPIIIFSITNRCNLHCIGCYEQTFRPDGGKELDEDRIRTILAEAKELGVSFFVLAGGEPFMRPNLLDMLADYPEIIFLVFTNGLLLTNQVLQRLKKQRNVVPLVSLEGDEPVTDQRRGSGVYKKVVHVMREMHSLGIFFGTSLTLTRQNCDQLISESFVNQLADSGCKFFLYIEYTPVAEGTEDWILTESQRIVVPARLQEYRTKFPALFIAVPWDEDEVGGCLSAGRGFVHINAAGNVEPCPFAPFSHTDVREMSLKEALQSDFFRAIREVPELSRETGGGCVLWKERELVEQMLGKVIGTVSETEG